MSKRFIAAVVVAVVGAATFLVASPALAETCLPLPPTTGATLEVVGQDIRIPATSGVAVCVEPGGLPGTPRVDSDAGATSLVVSGGSNTPGHVLVRYSIDGVPAEQRVPIPGTGPGTETCIASVGEAPRDDCLLFELTIDDVPTIPPTPTTGPPPTVSPVPTVPPLPTPEPDAVVAEVARFLADPCNFFFPQVTCTVDPWVLDPVRAEVDRFLADPCNYLLPKLTCSSS